MPSSTLILIADDGNPILLSVAPSSKLDPGDGVWDVDTNRVLLGSDKWNKWSAFRDNPQKRKALLANLQKVSQTKLT